MRAWKHSRVKKLTPYGQTFLPSLRVAFLKRRKYYRLHFSKNSKYNKIEKSAHFSRARYPRLWHKDLYPNKALPQTLVKLHQTFTFWCSFTRDNGIAKIKYVILMPQCANLPTQHENTTLIIDFEPWKAIFPS